MTPPFEKLGPGQSGRLVYQVLGKDGPFFNPKGIRYLPPDAVSGDMVSVTTQGPEMALGLAGVNLAASAGVLAIAAATYHSVQSLHEKVDRIEADLSEARAALAKLEARTEAIHLKVEESHLREAMRDAFRRAWKGDGFLLEALVPLKDDVLALIRALDSTAVFNTSLRLSSDIRSTLNGLVSMLRNLRLSIVREHNMRVLGEPTQVISIKPNDDYFREVAECLAFTKDIQLINDMIDNFELRIKEAVANRFTFYSVEDERVIDSVVDEELRDPLTSYMSDAFPAEAVGAFYHLDNAWFAELDREEAGYQGAELFEAWLWQYDAGLIYRVYIELVGLEMGYELVYPSLATGPLAELTEATIACDLPELIAEAAEETAVPDKIGGFW